MSVLVVIPIGPESHDDITPYAIAYGMKLASRYGQLVTPTKIFVRRYERENYWARFARLRNYIIGRYLKVDHTEVLWIDSDIVKFPDDLYADLVAARPDPRDIISPMTLIEGTDLGGDPAGCRDSRDRRSTHEPPWFSTQPTIASNRGDGLGLIWMASVGACVLVPAEIHRHYDFKAQRDLEPTAQTEWLSLCDGAHSMKRKVWLDTRIQVEHADLPRYGIPWHSGLQELEDWGVA